jgi:hypothetical protein
MCLAGLIVITAVNLWGIAESARALMLPIAISAMQVRGPASARPRAGPLVHRWARRSDRLRPLRTLRPLPRLVTMW